METLTHANPTEEITVTDFAVCADEEFGEEPAILNAEIDLTLAAVLIDGLADRHGLGRRRARETLVKMGAVAVPYLTRALTSGDHHVRWEAAKALGQICHPDAAKALVVALEDHDGGIRWLAAEGLIPLRCKGLRALLEALVHRSGSVWLREGARHILRNFSGDEKLAGLVAPVLAALDSSQPILQAPIAAEFARGGPGRPPGTITLGDVCS